MIAYHNKPDLKEQFLARVRQHRAADELIQGATQGRMAGGAFRGCAVVCTLEVYDHELVDWAFREQRLWNIADSRTLFHAEFTDPGKYVPTIVNDYDCPAARHFRQTPLVWHTA